jgi:hypothetical protein
MLQTVRLTSLFPSSRVFTNNLPFLCRPVQLQTLSPMSIFFQSEKYFKYSSSGSICNNNCCICVTTMLDL